MSDVDSNTRASDQRFERSIASLEQIFRFLERFFEDNRIDAGHRFPFQLAVEEVFSNMVRHNTSGEQEIAIRLSVDQDKITVVLIDVDGMPYDLTLHPEPDITAKLEDRDVGGLGIHLVKRMVDELHYDYSNQQSVITLIRNLTR